MKNQKGSVLLVGLLGFFLVLFLFGAGTTVYAVSVRNTFVKLENSIVASYDESKNVHTNYVLKIKEMAQVPKMATDQLATVIREAIQGRYGDDGSKAVVQFIREQNPTISPALYENIQKEIAGGRSDFKAAITRVTDQKRVAKDMLDDTVGGFFLSLMGMPRLNIGYNGGKDDYPVIMSEQSAETYKSGIDKGIDMLGK